MRLIKRPVSMKKYYSFAEIRALTKERLKKKIRK